MTQDDGSHLPCSLSFCLEGALIPSTLDKPHPANHGVIKRSEGEWAMQTLTQILSVLLTHWVTCSKFPLTLWGSVSPMQNGGDIQIKENNSVKFLKSKVDLIQAASFSSSHTPGCFCFLSKHWPRLSENTYLIAKFTQQRNQKVLTTPPFGPPKGVSPE